MMVQIEHNSQTSLARLRRRSASRNSKRLPIAATFSSGEILACDQAGITVTLPKPITSGVEAKGRFGKQDFRYVAEEDVYVCPAGEKLVYHYTNEENGLVLLRYWTNACLSCAIKQRCTTGKERRIARWKQLASPPRPVPALGGKVF